MSHKVDISEVIEFSKDFATASTNLKSHLNDVEKSINQLESMHSFTGKTANEAKKYFNDLHKTLLKSFENVFTELEERMTSHLNSFKWDVDSSESAIIESGYLLETEKNINNNYERFHEEQETIRETLANVSDISSAHHPSILSFDRNYNSTIDITSDLEENLESYTSKDNENISEIDELLHHIETTIRDIGAVTEDNHFTYFKGSTTPDNLLTLMGYNQATHKLMVEEAKESSDYAVENMDDSSQEIAVKALNDLDNEVIDEDEYYAHLDELRKLNNDDHSDGEVSENFIKYVLDNFDETSESVKGNSMVTMINEQFKRAGNKKLGRAELIKAINANQPGAGAFMKEQGNKVLKVGRAVTGSVSALAIGIGTYVDYTNTDKTLGEAGTKNIVDSAVTSGFVAATSYAVIKVAAVAGASTPVGWAIIAGIATAAIVTTGFNYVYDNNVLGLQDKLDWAGQKLDDAGEAVSGFVDDAGEAVSGFFDAINPFS